MEFCARVELFMGTLNFDVRSGSNDLVTERLTTKNH